MGVTLKSKVRLIDNRGKELTIDLSEPAVGFSKKLLLGKNVGEIFLLIGEDGTVEYKVIEVL